VKLKTLRPRLATIPGRLQQATALQADRLRGRAAVKRRANWLHDHPLCTVCEAEDRVTAATVPDHRVPIWANGPDTEANLQSLCTEHHDAKTACEASMRAAGGWMATACTCGQHS
jgi:5-methylcytosine-specific restriction protein A